MTLPPLAGLRVVEMGSRVAAPYLAKLFVDAGAHVVKVESPAGDPYRSWSASGAQIAADQDGAMFRFLNAGKHSVVLDLESEAGRAGLAQQLAEAHLVLDDHAPQQADALGISAADLRAMNPAAVVTTVTRFGSTGPWADRAVNDFTLQALVGATENRGLPGSEPAAVGGELGEFVAASLCAPAVLAFTLAAQASGQGVHIDASQYEAMMLSFQTYRPMYDVFAPDFRVGREIEIPSVEPAKDGSVGYCTVTGQQWQDFCNMIGAPEWIDDPELSNFRGRMARRDEVLERIHAFTTQHTVDELVDLAAALRIPTGPIGSGDAVASVDHFAERGVFVENPHGFTQPRPPYQFSESQLAPLRPAPKLNQHDELSPPTGDVPRLGRDPLAPLVGIKVLDLSAFWAGPVSTNLLRVLGADLIKVESHIRLDGMRWASGLPIPMDQKLWEWSPVYHGSNVGKRVVNLDLGSARGLEILRHLVSEADVVVENFSPRVTEGWGLTWEAVQELNPATSLIRVPAFGLDGPWRDRVGFAMTMEQVSGLANRTGHPDGPPLNPRGPVDSLAGMHSVFGGLLALAERERTGRGQLVEMALIEGALQAAAEQVIEYSAYGNVLSRTGNRSASASPQGLYPVAGDDKWLAISVETDDQWRQLQSVVGDGLDGLDRHDDHDEIDRRITEWSAPVEGEIAAARLYKLGIPAAFCRHFNETGRSPQHGYRGFLQWRDHPVTGWTPYPSYPFQVDGDHLDLGTRAPLLGEHTNEILTELGFSAEELDKLWADGVCGDWPAGIPQPGKGGEQ